MSIYLTVTATPPAIVCPPWCTDAPHDPEELSEMDGRVIHNHRTKWHTWPMTPNRPIVEGRLTESTLTDGTPDPDDNYDRFLILDGAEYSLDAAERYARGILELVEEGRSGPTVRQSADSPQDLHR